MALMTWDEALGNGVASIDDQHRELVSLMNALYDSASTGEPRDTVRLFDQLLEHTVAHFRHEESLFINTGYPEAERHRRHHELLTAKAIEYRDCAAKGDMMALRAEVLPRLATSLTMHIQKDDKDTCAFLCSMGVA
ncbi:hemerythrin-like metal-binding protein [Rhizomicrobium palustre]|uniref:Hemerythrin-like metal-binding protein n=1 Tax=Rhizomicrobium palustre TaxID=189966 RepID=A0A846MYW6_9PROT|nr:bacteriohemerythrin [Rhizomicrobium palustre]NIK88834.1 hemerythrin-like metal-binding protein [Rhizomicrobium palustre]